MTEKLCKGDYLFYSLVIVMLLFLSQPVVSRPLTAEEREAGYIELFNGKDLNGWTVMGNPRAFVAEDGVIACHPQQGYYLRSARRYENFILRLEYKISAGGNSGVYFHTVDHGRISRVCGEIQIFDSYGKQKTSNSAGAIYDVYPPKENAARPADEWNDLEIFYEWPYMKITLNGKIVHDLNVEREERLKWRSRKGYIGLQDHGNPVWFRNIRVRDLGGNAESEWKPLFDGKDLEGWNITGDAAWRAQIGQLVAENGNGYAITEDEFKDFHLWTYVRTSEKANGGIFYRWKNRSDRGHEAQIYNVKGAKNMTGSIYNFAPVESLYSKDRQWFPMQIVAEGPRSLVIVNGKIVAEYHDTKNRPGNISLQMHDNNSTIQFKDIRIKPL